jgi:putative SOS response-associated peptidase YedK
MRWGIVPMWAKETSKPLINARSESVRENRSFNSSVSQRRCLTPADGSDEWTKIGKLPTSSRSTALGWMIPGAASPGT